MSVASMAIGPAIGIWLSDSYGYRVCMLVSTAMLFVAAFIAAMFPYIHRKSEIEFRITDVFSVPRIVEQKLIGLSGVNASFTMMNGIVSTYLVVFAAERGIHGSSWHFTVNAVVLILTRILMARKMNQWSLKQNLYPAFIFGIVTLLLIGWANSLLLLIIAAAAKAMAQSMSQPALQTEALRRVIPEKRGVACSTMYIGGDLGQAVGPILGGLLAQSFGYGNMFFASVIPLVFACIYFVIWSRSSR
jgi:predicted MFS family arabinose efflux permease